MPSTWRTACRPARRWWKTKFRDNPVLPDETLKRARQDRILTSSSFSSTSGLDAAHEVGYFVGIDGAAHDRRHRHVGGFLARKTGLDFVHDQFHRHRLTTIDARAADDLRLGISVDRSGHFLRQPPDIVEFRDNDQLGISAEFPQFLRRERSERADLDQADLDALFLTETDGFARLSRGATRGHDDRLGSIHILGRKQTADVFVDVFARTFN